MNQEPLSCSCCACGQTAPKRKMFSFAVQLFPRLFPWIYTLLPLLWLLEEGSSYPMPFYYPRQGLSRRNVISAKVTSLDKESTDQPLSYRLDAWSQYDNPEEGTEREGDIHEEPLSRKTSTRDRHLLWPKGVVRYHIDSTIINEPTKFAILQNALDSIMRKTCIRFIRIYPNDYGELPHNTWVNITGSNKGCFSDLGRSRYGPSVLNLDVEKCFRTQGHALHELLHTLGVFHEHMRPDRDEYIQILWENIKKGTAFNFHVLSTTAATSYGLPYDYDSVMHYSMTAFSKDKSLPSIVPLQKDATIGQRDHLSFYDVQKLLVSYNCNEINSGVLNHDIVYDHVDKVKGLDLNKTNLSKTSPSKLNAESSDVDETLDNVHINPLEILAAFGYFFYSGLLPEHPLYLIYPIYPDYIYY